MRNNSLNLKLINKELLIEYLIKEKTKRKLRRDFDNDFQYLNHDEDSFNFTLLYFVLVNNSIAGFCIVCSFQTDVLNRIYIDPDHRNLGLATYAIETLSIKNLCCFTNNEPAIFLYRKLGFKAIRQNGLYSVSMRR